VKKIAPAVGTIARPVVCVIDDNNDVRRFICKILQDAGFPTVDTCDGFAGVALAGSSGARVAIIDMVMPDRDGSETMADIKVRFPTIKVLAMSGGGSAAPKDYLRRADDFLAKPFKVSEMIGKVTALAERALS
jgi:DNA-binding response OmpR family regulator